MTDPNSTKFDFSNWPEGMDPNVLVGKVISNMYELTHYLGGGGFGEVFIAVNTGFREQRVVIKFLKNLTSDRKFEQEASILCKLDHPNICKIINRLSTERALVMQYIVGWDCSTLLNQPNLPNDEVPDSLLGDTKTSSGKVNKPKLSDELILNIARSVASAISYAHRKEVAHRDIKPRNIMIDLNKNVYLIDFGIAKKLANITETETGYQALTPSFAAPERISGGKAYNPYLSDIYELGATIMKLVGVLTPFEQALNRKRYPSKSISDSDLSSEFKKILLTATQQDPSKRYKTVDLMADDLSRIIRIRKKSNKLKIASSIVMFFIITIAIFFSLRTEISKINRQVVDENSELEFLVSTTNYSWQKISLDIANFNLPSGFDFHDNKNGTGLFKWVTTFSDSGEYSITVAAYHKFWGRDTQTVSILVENSNQRPTLDPINPLIVDEGGKIEVEVVARDLDGDEVTLFMNDLPENSSFKNNGSGKGLFEWTPYLETAGDYDFTIFVTDMRDTSVGSFSVKVNEVNKSLPNEKKGEIGTQDVLEFQEPALANYQLQIDINPFYNSSLFVDGTQRSIGAMILVDSGMHVIQIVHPDYPLLTDTFDIVIDKAVRYDLAQEYKYSDSLDILFSTVPVLDSDNLIVTFNGKIRASYNKDNRPGLFDTPLIQGNWAISFDLKSVTNRVNKVDSFKLVAPGGHTLRSFGSDSSIVTLSTPTTGIRGRQYLTVFWSSREERQE